MSQSLTEQLDQAGFFRHADPQEKARLVEAFANGNPWLMMDEALGRHFTADAEALAELGIGQFLREVQPYFDTQSVRTPDIVEDEGGADYYSVTVNHKRFEIWDEHDVEQETEHEKHGLIWLKASLATTHILNFLLSEAGSQDRAYAINGGNDLSFIFLTPAQHALLLQFKEVRANPLDAPYDLTAPAPASTPAPRRTFLQRYLRWLPLLLVLAVAKYYHEANQHADVAPHPQQQAQTTYAPQTPEPAPAAAPVPSYTLTLDGDYTVHRSQSFGPQRSLTWVIMADDQIVLERLAENELSYRYFNLRPGHRYTVFLKAYIDGGYQPVSDLLRFIPH
ncbi:MAG: hypothetical protein V4735_01625 [Pseudomonadota bacterium]